ncbi:hypothetical protein C0J45_18411 [Silurus meridionalis]|nr:hypothetical protein C0J45_18411 [Silurus meridionalis]
MSNSSLEWIQMNLGGFSQFATVQEMYLLNPEFDALEAFSTLTLKQVSEIIVEDLPQLPAKKQLIDITFSNMLTSLTMRQNLPQLIFLISEMDTTVPFSPPLVVDMLDVIADVILNTFSPNSFTNDSLIQLWFGNRLRPFLPYTSSNFLTCISKFNFSWPELMKCYTYQSFYAFLKSYFIGFQFPSLSTFLSLIPPGRMAEVTDLSAETLATVLSCYLYGNDTISNKTWKIFLTGVSPVLGPALDLFPNKINAMSNETQMSVYVYFIHTFLSNNNTAAAQVVQVLDNVPDPELIMFFSKLSSTVTEPVLSPALAGQTLTCVWPQAIYASSQTDINRWFNVTLVQYLPYLSSQMISSTQMGGVSCMAFSKFVFLLGNYNFSTAGFTKKDVYTTIQSYLTTENAPKCYDPTDPTLNSTAWFYQYIGAFITFITVEDLQQFGGLKLEQFTSNAQNLELFSKYNVSQDVITLYTDMLFAVDQRISIKLSVVGWSESQAMAIVQSLLSSGLFKVISVNSNPDIVVQNVPDNMAQLIPRSSLLFLSQQMATTLNQKQWTSNQAMLFFDTVAEQFNNADNISFQVLQGFTCTRVQSFNTLKVKNLIRGCRRRGNNKVTLQESQGRWQRVWRRVGERFADVDVVDRVAHGGGVSEVQGLLGTNLPDLKTYENNQVVHSWITQQLQSDLDTLGIGLTGGRALTPRIITSQVWQIRMLIRQNDYCTGVLRLNTIKDVHFFWPCIFTLQHEVMFVDEWHNNVPQDLVTVSLCIQNDINKMHHTRTSPPPPWATRSTTSTSANRSPTRRHTRCHLPCTVKTGIDLSRERTSLQSARRHRI